MKNYDELNEEEFLKRYVSANEIPYRILTWTMIVLAQILYRPKAYGVDDIPDDEAIIIATNHRAAPDPAFIINAYRKRPIRYMAKRKLNDGPFGLIFRLALTIPVDRSRKATKAVSAAELVLHNKGVIGIFPEGTRNHSDDILLPFKYGAVSLAQKTGAYLVPSVNVGRYVPFRSRVETYFAKPYKIAVDADLDVENEKLRQIMYDLYVEHAKDDEKVKKLHKQ